MKTVQKSCIENRQKQAIVQYEIVLFQSVYLLIHIVGIYSFLKTAKSYISYCTVNFLNLKYFKLC